MNDGLKVGWAETEITPGGRAELFGQYYQRVVEEVHLPLKAVAMVLEKESEVAVMVSLDLAAVAEDFEKELQERVKKDIPELDSSKIFLNAIHAHNAPGRCWLMKL